MHDLINHSLETWGYLFLFLLVGLESLGVPLPGETTLVTAAALAGAGKLRIELVLGTAAAAAILGDNGGYWIGRKGGLALLRRFGPRLRLDAGKLDWAQEFFRRHGAKAVFLGRFIAILRTWAAFLAGVSSMPYGVFTLYNALGGVTWALIFSALGYVFGRNLTALEHDVGLLSLVLALVVAGWVTLYLVRRRLFQIPAESGAAGKDTR